MRRFSSGSSRKSLRNSSSDHNLEMSFDRFVIDTFDAMVASNLSLVKKIVIVRANNEFGGSGGS